MPKVLSSNKLKVVELFAGVGGFRIGLDRASGRNKGFKTVWASQWEPATGKSQHAAWVYRQKFFEEQGIKDDDLVNKEFSNEDIELIARNPKRIKEIPDHDVLTGGFPCQDYSVAKPRSQAAGLVGKKGVLWWSIYDILKHKAKKGQHTISYLFLENVDRLLKSPTASRGKDFAIMLSSLNELGYAVEWRVVNAGEYGFPQRRKRVFILGFHKSTDLYKKLKSTKRSEDWIHDSGVMANAFPVTGESNLNNEFHLDAPHAISKKFSPPKPKGVPKGGTPFQNAGIMIDGRVATTKTKPYHNGDRNTLGDIVNKTKEKNIDESYYIAKDEEKKWKEQKGAHRYPRTSKSGHEYIYAEGKMTFPDRLDKASRTIVTGEGGRSASRFKHVISLKDKKNWPQSSRKIKGKTYSLRRLVPEELEALCMFDRGHTESMCVPGIKEPVKTPDIKRAFFMGNALVVGAIKEVGKSLLKQV